MAYFFDKKFGKEHPHFSKTYAFYADCLQKAGHFSLYPVWELYKFIAYDESKRKSMVAWTDARFVQDASQDNAHTIKALGAAFIVAIVAGTCLCIDIVAALVNTALSLFIISACIVLPCAYLIDEYQKSTTKEKASSTTGLHITIKEDSHNFLGFTLTVKEEQDNSFLSTLKNLFN